MNNSDNNVDGNNKLNSNTIVTVNHGNASDININNSSNNTSANGVNNNNNNNTTDKQQQQTYNSNNNTNAHDNI